MGNKDLVTDSAFYVGVNARAWTVAFRKVRPKAVREFEAGTPSDLVVEVEVSNPDEDKFAHYAGIGIREMWRVSSDPDGDFMVVGIIGLQGGNGPENWPDSLMFPDLRVEHLGEDFWRAWGNDHEGVAYYLMEKLALAVNPGAYGRKTVSPHPVQCRKVFKVAW
ncbi:MAG: hypothetical protein OXC57_09910 [Rhodobacteraceae bacterium]|nr:hypothetical protein [Paracoccaceae bacterium]